MRGMIDVSCIGYLTDSAWSFLLNGLPEYLSISAAIFNSGSATALRDCPVSCGWLAPDLPKRCPC